MVYWKHFCAQVGREPSTFGIPTNAFLCKKLLWHSFCNLPGFSAASVVTGQDFPAASVVTDRDFPAVYVVTDRDFPAVSVVTGRDRKTFLAWGNVKKNFVDGGKMSRYRQQDCLSLVLEFSDGKLKQEGYFIVQGSVSMRLLLVFINIFCSANLKMKAKC